MARKHGAKSQAVRDHLKEQPEASAKDVVTALGAKGMKVTANLVYFLKGAAKSTKQRKARVVKAAKAAHSNNTVANNIDALTMIREVKALAQKAGGIENLKSLVEALAE